MTKTQKAGFVAVLIAQLAGSLAAQLVNGFAARVVVAIGTGSLVALIVFRLLTKQKNS